MKQTKVFWGYVILTSIITLLWTGYALFSWYHLSEGMKLPLKDWHMGFMLIILGWTLFFSYIAFKGLSGVYLTFTNRNSRNKKTFIYGTKKVSDFLLFNMWALGIIPFLISLSASIFGGIEDRIFMLLFSAVLLGLTILFYRGRKYLMEMR